MRNPLIDALCNPAVYPHDAGEVKVIETHISWILLTGEFAYKIKKPVDFGFLDFSTLEKRKYYCEEELRLNRRFSDTLYIDVVEISGSAGEPKIGGAGMPVEYAVRMKEFSQQCLLSALLGQPDFNPRLIEDLARQLATFHRRATVIDNNNDRENSPGDEKAVVAAALDNFIHIRPLLNSGTDKALLDELQAWTEQQGEQLLNTFAARKCDGFVRECHGDLHLENIAVIDGEVIFFDCIEFNEEFRCIDVVSELAYVVMDMEYRGYAGFANTLLNRYLEHTGDYQSMQLLDFYRVYRAMVRAKVAILRSQQEGQSGAANASESFYRYMALANSYRNPRRPFLAIMHGVSGTGKSTASLPIAQQLGAIRLRSDVERKRLFGLQAGQSSEGVKGGIYTPAATDATFTRLMELASGLLADGFPVIVDATFLSATRRHQFSGLARKVGVAFVVLDCYLDEALLVQRLQQRSAAITGASEADVKIMYQQVEKQDPLTNEELACSVSICTAEALQGDALEAVSGDICALCKKQFPPK